MDTRRAGRFSPESRIQAQCRFRQAIESLKKREGLTAGELDLLLAQRPVGIDDENHIVIEYATEAEAAKAAVPAFIRASWEVHRLGLAKRVRQLVVESVRKRKPRAGRSGPSLNPIVYLPTRLVATTLPYRRVKGSEFTRANGEVLMSLVAPAHSGLPYGIYPRLALMHITTCVVLHRARHFVVGGSFNAFLGAMGISDSGGPRGGSTRVREQLRRLCRTTFSWENQSRDRESWRGVLLTDSWDRRPGTGLQVTVSQEFFKMARSSSVPLDATLVRELRSSPLALDTYAWLTWRVWKLEKETRIPWLALERQLGSQYRSHRQFRWEFRKRLDQVRRLWSGLDAEPQDRGLLVRPCDPSVRAWLERHHLTKAGR